MIRPLQAGCLSALLVAFCLTACEPPEETSAAGAPANSPHPTTTQALTEPLEIGRPGGSRTIVVPSLPNSLNPYLGSEQSSLWLLTQLFVGLVRIDGRQGRMEPALAASLTPSPDQKTWTIRLRPGLQWSDGQPLTADDVVFTYTRIINNPLIPNNYRDFWAYQGDFPRIEALDPQTVRFTLTRPFAPFRNNLVAPILPRHVFATSVSPDRQGKVAFNSMWGINARISEIVVNGPWKLANFSAGARAELVRNPHYFERDAQGQHLPYLDKLIFIEAADPNLALVKFQQGETDAYVLRPEDYSLLAARQKHDGFSIYNLGPTPSQLFVTFNQSTARRPDGQALVAPVKSAWFRNLCFRKALAASLNKKAMIENVYQGRAQAQFSHLSPSNPFFDPALKDTPYDPAAAKRWLQAGGFHPNAAGELLDATGHRVSFELSTNAGNLQRDAICGLLRSEWSKLGIHVDYRPLPFNLISRKLHESHDWEVLVAGLAGSPIEPHFSSSRWKRSGRMHLFNMGSGPNWPGQPTRHEAWEVQMEDLYARAAVATDPQARKALYFQAQELEQAQLPFLYLVSELNLLAVRNSLGNARPSVYGGSGMQQLNWNSQFQFLKGSGKDRF